MVHPLTLDAEELFSSQIIKRRGNGAAFSRDLGRQVGPGTAVHGSGEVGTGVSGRSG